MIPSVFDWYIYIFYLYKIVVKSSISFVVVVTYGLCIFVSGSMVASTYITLPRHLNFQICLKDLRMASTLNVVVGESSQNKTLKAHIQCIEMAPEKLLAFHCSKLPAIILKIVMSNVKSINWFCASFITKIFLLNIIGFLHIKWNQTADTHPTLSIQMTIQWHNILKKIWVTNKKS